MPTQIVVAIDDPSNRDAWGLRPYGAWSAGPYPQGAVASYSGSLWLASVQTSGVPGISADWAIMVPAVVGATGAMFPQGDWNASTNSPTLASSVGTEGYIYRVSADGATTLNGQTNWNANDFVAFIGGAWRKIRGPVLNSVDITDATAAGRSLLTAADASAQRTAIGSTAAGSALLTAANAAAQRTSLGATAAGSAIFTAADAAAQRTAMSALASGEALVRQTAATMSGLNIDFGSIPSWAKRIVVMFNGVSISGTSDIIVQLGTSGGIVSSGYVSNSYRNASLQTATNGFILTGGMGAASNLVYGHITICNLSGNVWTESGLLIATTGTAYQLTSAGVISLGGALTTVRIATANGSDTFDAGSVNVMYD